MLCHFCSLVVCQQTLIWLDRVVLWRSGDVSELSDKVANIPLMSLTPPRLRLPPCRSHLKVCQSKASSRTVFSRNPRWLVMLLPWGKTLCRNCSSRNLLLSSETSWLRHTPPYSVFAHVDIEETVWIPSLEPNLSFPQFVTSVSTARQLCPCVNKLLHRPLQKNMCFVGKMILLYS